MENSCYVVVAIGLVTSRMLTMVISVVSLLFKQIKTDLLNCLQSITLLQIKYYFVLKMNHMAFSFDSSLHVAMYRFVIRKSCEYNFVLSCIA